MSAASPLRDHVRIDNYAAQLGHRHQTPRQRRRTQRKAVRTLIREVLPPCGMTDNEHADTWQTWRDDCPDCGYSQQDAAQCAAGHPDDGATYCGHCGYDSEVAA